MTVAFFIIAIGIWVLYSGWRFYKEVKWTDPKDSDERRSGQERRRRHRRKIDASDEKVIK